MLDRWIAEATATYNYELTGCSGTIHTHSMAFSEFGSLLIVTDPSTTACAEPIDVQLERTVNLSAFNDLFAGYDSVTVHFSILGLFQECSGGSADSIAEISWTDSVRVQVD